MVPRPDKADDALHLLTSERLVYVIKIDPTEWC